MVLIIRRKGEVLLGEGTLVKGSCILVPKTSATATGYLLALATLSETTQIGSFLSLSLCPRWPRQIQVSLSCEVVAGVVALPSPM